MGSLVVVVSFFRKPPVSLFPLGVAGCCPEPRPQPPPPSRLRCTPVAPAAAPTYAGPSAKAEVFLLKVKNASRLAEPGPPGLRLPHPGAAAQGGVQDTTPWRC